MNWRYICCHFFITDVSGEVTSTILVNFVTIFKKGALVDWSDWEIGAVSSSNFLVQCRGQRCTSPECWLCDIFDFMLGVLFVSLLQYGAQLIGAFPTVRIHCWIDSISISISPCRGHIYGWIRLYVPVLEFH